MATSFTYSWSSGFYGDQDNAGPDAPTNVAIADGLLITGVDGTLTWTHNDPDLDPQIKYQIAWRVVV